MQENRKIAVFFVLTLAAAVPAKGDGHDQASPNQLEILIINVRLIDRDGRTEDVVVNIHIKDGVLRLITGEEMSMEGIEFVCDAKNGVVLGKLEIGTPATFMILDEDPRENSGVLLDTKSHTVFAIEKGQTLLNVLSRIGPEYEKKEKYSGWRSYTTPPVALPLSYQTNKKWNVFRTKPVTIIFAAAAILESTTWLAQDNENQTQVGALDEFEGGSIRGARFGLAGTLNFKKPWTYTVFIGNQSFERGFEQGELDKYLLFDYRLDIPIGKITMSIGKQKEPISMERLAGLVYLPQQERTSISDGILPARNTGIVLKGWAIKRRMSWAVGAFNRWFEIGKSFSETASQLVGRITGIPFMTEDESNLLHVGFSGRYSNANEGIRYKTRTEIYRGPFSVDTELLEADSSFTYDLEAAWRKGPFLLAAESMLAHVRALDYGPLTFGGYHITGSWIISGEMRKYNKSSRLFERIKVAKPVSSGGSGAWEVTARWSSIDLTDGAIDGGKMDTFSAGMSWWPSDAFCLNINYRYSILDRSNLVGTNHGIVTRLTLLLE